MDGDDYVRLNGCLGQPPSGPCVNADINCDGVIDDIDQGALGCLMSEGTPAECRPYILNLEEFPFEEAEGPDYHEMNGAATLKMALDWLWQAEERPPGDPETQGELYTYALVRNYNGESESIDTVGMVTTLQKLIPLPFETYGYRDL